MGLPIILDIGRSVDDFFAVALAACSPELKLLAVTTAQDQTGERARVVRALLGAYGRTDVTVAAGRSSRGERGFLAPSIRQLELTHGPLAPASPLDAATLMAQTIADHRASLVFTGPLTNLADLLQAHSEAPERIDHVYFMGGWPTQGLPEHNVELDPDAASYVLQHCPVPLTAAGYEVTRGRRLLRQHLKQIENSASAGPRTLYTLYMAGVSERPSAPPVMHDPLMLAYLCRPTLVISTETIRVAVDTKAGPGRGAMYQDPQTGKSIRIFTQIDAPSYLDFLVDRIAPQVSSSTKMVDPSRWHVELRSAQRVDHFPGWSVQGRRRPTHTIAIIVDGTCIASIANQVLHVESEGVLYAPPNVDLSVETNTGMNAIWLEFDVVEKFAHIGYQSVETIPWPYRILSGRDRVWTTMGERIIRHWSHPLPEGALLCKAALFELLASLCARSHEEAIRWVDPAREAALKAKRWIESNFAENLTLAEIASRVSLSKYYLLRVFREAFGMPPLQYLVQLRIQQAKRLLNSESLTIADVAKQVGYTSPTAFTRAFKRETGLSPTDYRNSPNFWNS